MSVVFMTGATGMIGSNIAKLLVEGGDSVGLERTIPWLRATGLL
jgi:nucleoside-diphosphate-sugar epimerase